MCRGFSLVELSIVLVILGLLAGGVVAGQSLIRAAELRGVAVEFASFVAGTSTFRDKYLALPGDMANATDFWGKDNTNCSSHAGISAVRGTCNGDGDGRLTSAAANGASGEAFQYWKQLALAGIIPGSYTGLAGVPSSGPVIGQLAVPGDNVPRSKLGSTVGWSAIFFNLVSGNGSYFDYPAANRYLFGVRDNDEFSYAHAVKPEDLLSIDTKLDDGRPALGRVMAIHWAQCTTAASSADRTAEYRVNVSSVSCAAQFNGIE
jgi:prepilin-type N-terminal cleavage/methylation domain-containing protein